MRKIETIPRDAPLEGPALTSHLRGIAAECRETGQAHLRDIRRETRSLTLSLAILKARHERDELTPAAVWLVDNSRMLEEACITLNEALHHAPCLPASKGEVRIARFAREWLSHTTAQADGPVLEKAVAAWQISSSFTETELNLLPLAVQRALLLIVTDVAAGSAEAEKERAHAEASLDISARNRFDAYWERLSCLLQEREDADALAQLDEKLSELGTTATEIAEKEHDLQTRTCLWAGNAIASLKAMASIDWRAQVESLSSIEHWLRMDPAGIYNRMDFASRSMYRRRAAKLSKCFQVTESAVAKKALGCAERSTDNSLPELSRHVGYYLMDQGQPILWKALGKVPLLLRLARFIGQIAATGYVAMIFLGSLCATALLLAFGIQSWLIAPAMLVAGEGFRQLAGIILHHLSSPRRMARLAPDHLDDAQVLVVVPTLLTNRTQALEMARHLSVLRLANPESRLSYMLLGDFKDSPAAVEPDDPEITNAALTAIQALNDVWNGGFYYLHRARVWNDSAKRFMGPERKRGALMALNDLLLFGKCSADFVAQSCPPEALSERFSYVITLDADTQLPPGTALELVGMLQHPLNRPCIVNSKRRGCAVIQPRMETSAATIKTRIARIWGGDGGFDPYITTFSDIYQNLCGEGSFAGKGVYHVPSFVAATHDKILDNTVLSHDLLEGSLAGSSLACDVALYDCQPSSLSSWMKRLHRWTRGDWQLLPWLIPFVKGENGWFRNPLSILNQYKIYDNLRRSLVPLAAVVLLIWGIFENAFVAVLAGLLLPWVRSFLPPSWKGLRSSFTHLLLLPYEAYCMVDAAARTLWRVLVSRKHLLEWIPSADAEQQRADTGLQLFWPNHLASGLLILASMSHPTWFFFSIPLATLWAMAPWTAKWLDAKERRQEPITPEQKQVLMDIATHTLRFFDETVTEETNHLPPDNLQLEPPRGIAPRTSPTNIGMYLLACVSAHELGMLDSDTMARRIEKTIITLEKMEKWRGHLMNWYDIRTLAPLSHRFISSVDSGNLVACLLLAAQALRSCMTQVDASLLSLPARLDALASATDFSCLYDPKADLFYVGIFGETGTPGDAHYDLMASEARLLSYLALMRREAPLKHWHRLGRSMTKTRQGAALLSWSGTMFEYLLPTLFLKSPHVTLLGDTCLHAAKEQAEAFGNEPWGISESGYYAFDPMLSYQYKAFGLPLLALRTAHLDRVIAPYASALALEVLPREAAHNLQRMVALGWLGDLGFYEAIDYCPERLPKGADYRIVRSHMAHHQGMILAAICNHLTDGALTQHFHSLPQTEAYALLLEERKPSRAMLRSTVKSRRIDMRPKPQNGTLLRHVSQKEFPPEALVLYGGGTTMVYGAKGSGYISHNGLLLTRRRLDPLYEGGPQMYLRLESGKVIHMNDATEVWFDRSQATYRLEEDGLEAELTCFVSPIDGAAVHLLKLRTLPGHSVTLDVASFLEVCLSSLESDEAHPTFRNLSVEAWRIGPAAAVAHRRSRHRGERFPLMLHAFGAEKMTSTELETSRLAFLGRGERLKLPQALEHPFAGSLRKPKSSIDPCLSIRAPLSLEAGTTQSCWFVTAAVEDEAKALALSAQYASLEPVIRALELATTQDDVTAKYHGLDVMAQLSAQRMVSWLLAPLAPKNETTTSRSTLWKFSISGDLPIVVVWLWKETHLPLARSATKAHAYLRAMGLWFDLVFLNSQREGYNRPLQDALINMITGGSSRDLIGQSAGLHIVDALNADDSTIQSLLSQGALVLRGGDGSLAAQIAMKRATMQDTRHPWGIQHLWPAQRPLKAGSLGLDNGFGGFRADGSYVLYDTPLVPWCNVLANPDFGTLITDRGAGFTWYKNSRLFRLTPFASDPVRDQRSENLWLRDEESGHYVCPMENALLTHGFGFSRFESQAFGLRLTLDIFVDPEMPVKCMLLEVTNPGDELRSLSLTTCVRWQMGALLQEAANVRCELQSDAVIARCPTQQQPAFLLSVGREPEASKDGASFLGMGGMSNPRGMRQKKLEDHSGSVPSGILRIPFAVDAGNQETLCILLGIGDPGIIGKVYRNGGAQTRLARVHEAWRHKQEALMPRLPDTAATVLLGCWLPYQALSSRLYAHAGFYQAGGAIGFRDQLQDVLAFRYTDPEMVRSHLLQAAAHQFEAGDVQHWWHPPAKGVRTRITDDRLFLPYVTAAYIQATEDNDVLGEKISYLANVSIEDGQEDWYGEASSSDTIGTLHEHNLRAIHSIRFGEHGLPLMGAGDWNDGMSAVGTKERGESVWLGFFLAVVLKEYAPFCTSEEAAELFQKREALMKSLEAHAWDGAWYLRAWFDDGIKLGSHESKECQIDLVVQAWAVLAGAAHGEEAVLSALDRLLDGDAGILQLLDPPFDGETEPGYIRAYPPGVRENGGQYTHAAIWFVMACAKLGRMDLAWRLFFMLLPTSHSMDQAAAKRYRVEPYVVAADILSGEHAGQGGWTWYTGSASLLWSLGMETLLGFEKRGKRIRLHPSAPKEWNGYTIEYRYGKSLYVLHAERGGTDDGWVDLIDDGKTHEAVFALKR